MIRGWGIIKETFSYCHDSSNSRKRFGLFLRKKIQKHKTSGLYDVGIVAYRAVIKGNR